MNISIVYDSIYGNTAKVAEAIAAELASLGHVVTCMNVRAAQPLSSATELLIVGSPTRGFVATPAMREYAAGLTPPRAIPGAAFDTRLVLDSLRSSTLRWCVNVGGYAASRMAAALTEAGIVVADEDVMGFLVEGLEGPLRQGELARARRWARDLVEDHSNADRLGSPSGGARGGQAQIRHGDAQN